VRSAVQKTDTLIDITVILAPYCILYTCSPSELIYALRGASKVYNIEHEGHISSTLAAGRKKFQLIVLRRYFRGKVVGRWRPTET